MKYLQRILLGIDANRWQAYSCKGKQTNKALTGLMIFQWKMVWSVLSWVVALRQPVSNRSSHRRCFVKNVALKNFANFTGRHLCWSLFLIKLQAFRPATLIKKRIEHRCFPVKFTKFLRTAILNNLFQQ